MDEQKFLYVEGYNKIINADKILLIQETNKPGYNKPVIAVTYGIDHYVETEIFPNISYISFISRSKILTLSEIAKKVNR